MALITIDQYKEQNPQLKDVDNFELAKSLHEKYYPQVPFRDFTRAVDVTDPNEPGNMHRGFSEAIDQVKPMAFGAMAGAAAAGESIAGQGGIFSAAKNYAVKGMQNANAKIAENAKPNDDITTAWDNAKQGDLGALVDWASHGLGYAAAQTLMAGGTALVGAAVAPEAAIAGASGFVARGLITPLVERESAKLAAKGVAADQIQKLAVSNVAKTIGATTALGAYETGMEGGEIGGGLAEKSVNEGRTLTPSELAKGFGSTILAAGGRTVIDSLNLSILKGDTRGLFGIGESLSGVAGKLTRGAAMGAKSGLAEGTEEAGQTYVEEYGKGNDLSSPETTNQVINATAMGALGGHAVGTVGGILSSPSIDDAIKNASDSVSKSIFGPLALTHQHWGSGDDRSHQAPNDTIKFSDGSQITADEFFVNRMREHGDEAKARQETYQALVNENKNIIYGEKPIPDISDANRTQPSTDEEVKPPLAGQWAEPNTEQANIQHQKNIAFHQNEQAEMQSKIDQLDAMANNPAAAESAKKIYRKARVELALQKLKKIEDFRANLGYTDLPYKKPELTNNPFTDLREKLAAPKEPTGSIAERTASGGMQKQTAPASTEKTEQGKQEAAPTFTPTHITSDGAIVAATEEPYIYQDRQGNEYEDHYATPINKSNVLNKESVQSVDKNGRELLPDIGVAGHERKANANNNPDNAVKPILDLDLKDYLDHVRKQFKKDNPKAIPKVVEDRVKAARESYADDYDNALKEREASPQGAQESGAEKSDAESKAINDDIDGFMDDAKPFRKGLAINALNKKVDYRDKVTTIKQLVRDKVAGGETTSTEEEDKIKPMTAMQSFKADNREQLAHEKRVKDAGKKTTYYVGDTNLGKIAYDYANHLKQKQEEPNAKQKPEAAQPNGSSSTRPEIRQEDGNTPVGGRGVRESGQENKPEAKGEKGVGEESASEVTETADTKKAKADLDAALGDLGAFFLDNNLFSKKVVPGEFDDAKLMPIMARVMDAAIRLGYAKFKDAAKFTLDTIREKFGDKAADAISIDHLQGGYIAVAAKHSNLGTDNKKDVVNVESIEEINSHLPDGWSEASPGGMITNKDPVTGGIVDDEIKSGKWFAIPNNDSVDKLSGFDTRQQALNALQQAVKNASSTNSNLESDSKNPNAKDSGNEKPVSDDRTGNGQVSGLGSQETETSRNGLSADSINTIDVAAAGGERGNKPIHSTEQPTLSTELPPGVDDSERSDNPGNSGIQAELKPSAEIKSLSEQGNQKTVATRKVELRDKDNIRSTVPALNPGQVDDIHLAETRFEEHHGVLFTNGTGTGKTFSALGIIKRFALQGKNNIIIVVPSTNIADQWINAAEKFFGLPITRLEDTSTSGKGIVITTYANFGMNRTLGKREFDLVVADESHKLMQSESGEVTDALRTLRAISYHMTGFYTWFDHNYPEIHDELSQATAHKNATRGDDVADDRYDKAHKAYLAAKAKAEPKYQELQKSRPKVTFLSATPFAYVKTIDYAEGYLFDYGSGDHGLAYNFGDNQDKFYMQHFGYRMRYNKLTRPDANVDTGIMERQFNSTLKRSGALSFRGLDVPFDYDRKFVLTENAIGQRIDEAMEWIREKEYRDLADLLNEKFDYLQRHYLLEAIKAREAIPIIKDHLALGRKVLVFHDYKKGGAVNPFLFFVSEKANPELAGQVKEFDEKFGDLVGSFAALASPIDALTNAFGDDLMVYNGDVPAKERIKLVAQFNDDNSGKNLILAQSASAKEGVSFHDTTGKHQRVLINLGLPTQPTSAIQQEGRIYRIGQQSDALMRYLNTGTNWERWAFASTIASRASTAENLGAGEGARALKDAFINGFENNDSYPAGYEGEGKGGKEEDKAAVNTLTEFDRAKSLYFGQQKKTSRNKSSEGKDYYATPEPLGLKMAEWANINPGNHVLEPSAGHGAIARWFRDDANRTAIEPSAELSSKLALIFDGDIKRQTFEDLHIVNKYDAVVMNPPFGTAGKLAVEHLSKGFRHLKDGGRIVALIPEGSTNNKFDKWYFGDEAQDAHLVASISLPTSTFERAGTGVKTRIVIIDKVTDKIQAATIQERNADFSNAENIGELFNRIEDYSVPDRKISAKEKEKAEADEMGFKLEDTEHTKTKEKLFSDKPVRHIGDDYKRVSELVKDNGGYYSKFTKSFLFKSAEDRKKFLDAYGESGIKFSKNTRKSFDDFLKETKSDLGLNQFLASKSANGDITLSSLIVGKNEQKQGKGTEAMNRLVDYADETGSRIILTPGLPNDNHGTTSRARLVNFYKRFGFKENKGRNIDFVIGAGKMVREPSSKFSKGQSPGSMADEVKSWLPARVKKLLDSGKVKVIQSHDGNAQAFYNPSSDTITLVADNISEQSLPGILAHELLHRAEATDSPLKSALNRFEKATQDSFSEAAKGNASPIENRAAQRVIAADTPIRNQAEEFRAYLVSEYSKARDTFTGVIKKAMQDLVAAIRVALLRSGLDMGFIKTLTPADLAAMSKYGAKYTGESPLSNEPPIATLSSKKDDHYASWSINSDPEFDEDGNESEGDDYALIDKIYVPEARRKQGIGRKLLRNAIYEIQHEYPGIDIKIAALPFGENKMEMEDLVNFYEKEGFSVSNTDGHAVIMEYSGPKIQKLENVPESDGTLYSKSIDDIRNQLTDNIAMRLHNNRTFNNWWDKSVGTQFHKSLKDKYFGRVYNASMQYEHEVSMSANEAADKAPLWLPKLETLKESIQEARKTGWQRIKDAKAIGKAIFDTTIHDTPMSDSELKAEGYTPKQIEMYKQFYSAVNKSLDDLGKSEMYRMARIMKNANGDPLQFAPDDLSLMDTADFYAGQITSQDTIDLIHDGQEEDSAAAPFIQKAESIEKLKSEGYAPLMRFGKYTVDVVSKDGVRLFYGMLESQKEANQIAAAMRNTYEDAKVTQGEMSQKSWKQFQGITPETLEIFARMAGVKEEEAFQEYLKLAVNNRSALKRLIHRKKIPGYSIDAQRILATFITSNARRISKNKNLGNLLKSISEIPKEKGDVIDEALDLYDYVQNPQAENGVASFIKSGLFTWYLGGSLAAAGVNLTQTATTTTPYLAQFSKYGDMPKIIVSAAKFAANPKSIQDADLKSALKKADEQGVTAPQEVHYLYGTANPDSLAKLHFLRPLQNAWGIFFSLAEAYNRRLAFIAAYSIAKKGGKEFNDAIKAMQDKGVEAPSADPYEFASQAVDQTQFVYTKSSRPNWARSSVGQMMFTFKTFSISYLEFISRLPPKEKLLALGILVALAGLSGLPGSDDLDDVIDTIGQESGYNTNSKMWKRQVLEDMLGKEMAAYAQYGLSNALPIDISSRLGIANVIPGSAILKKSETDKSRDVMEFAGPAGSIAQKAIQTFEAMGSRDTLAGKAETFGKTMLPKAITDIIQAIDMENTGQYRDFRGYNVTKVGTGDAIAKAVGFNPNTVAERRRPELELMQSIKMTSLTESEIVGLWAAGVYEKDSDKIDGAKRLLKDWNMKNPETPIKINMQQVIRRTKAMRQTSAERLLKAAPKELRRSLAI